MKKMITRRQFMAAAGVVAAASALTACGGSSASTAASSAAGSTAGSAAASGSTIKVGVLGPMTGDASVYGLAVRYIALVLTVFGSLALTFGSEACQGFFYLLSYVFLANLLLDDRFLETIPVIVVTVVLVATLVIITTTGTLLTAAGMRSFTSTTTVVASTLEVGCIVDIHLLLIIINAETFLLDRKSTRLNSSH